MRKLQLKTKMASDEIEQPTAVDLLQDDPQDTTTESTPKVEAPEFDYSKLGKEFGAAIAEHLGPVKADPQPKELTPEEVRKMLNIWEPDDSFMQQFGNLETQKDALLKLRDGLARQMFTINERRTKEIVDEVKTQFEKEYAPLREQFSAYQQREQESRFSETYPELAKPTLKPLLAAVADQLRLAGKKFDSEGAAFAAIAAGAEAVIREHNPTFKLSSPAGGGKSKTNGNPNAQPVTSHGAGRGGGNSAAAAATGRPKAVSLLS